MFLNGIKFTINQPQATAHAYRFSVTSGRYRNMICFSGSPERFHHFRAALIFGLLGEEHEHVKQSIIYCSDDNGDHWIVDRAATRLKVFRNKMELESSTAEHLFLSALLELSPDDLELEDARSRLISLIDLHCRDGKYYGRNLRDQNHAGRHNFMEELNRLVEPQKKSVRQFLGLDSDLEPEQYRLLAQGLDQMVAQWQLNELQLQNQKVPTEVHSDMRMERIARLKEELRILETLEQLSQVFNDPAKSPTVLRERLDQVEDRLRRLRTEHRLASLDRFAEEVDWEKLLSIYCRYKAYEKLERFFRLISHRAENRYQPLADRYLESMQEFIRSDRKILSELEQTLSGLTQCIQQATQKPVTPQVKKRGVAAWIDKIVDANSSQSDTVVNDSEDQNIWQDLLEDSRSLVNKVLRILGKLQSDFDISRQSSDEGLQDLLLRQEKIVAEYGRARAQWLEASKALHLDPNVNLKDIISLLRNLSEIQKLLGDRDQIQEGLNTYRSKLSLVREELRAWYQVTGSAKDSNLAQPSMILRELKTILSYQNKKKFQLSKLENEQITLEARTEIYRGMIQVKRDLLYRWRQHFSSLSLEAPDFCQADLPLFCDSINKISALYSCLRADEAPREFRDWLEHLSLDTPMTIFQIPRSTLSESERSEFLMNLQFASPHGHALILSQDPLITESMKSVGISCASEIDLSQASRGAERSKPLSSKSLTHQEPPRKILSERAQAALELFKARNL